MSLIWIEITSQQTYPPVVGRDSTRMLQLMSHFSINNLNVPFKVNYKKENQEEKY